MHTKSKISKMFGALVLGGGVLITSTNSDAEPADNTETSSEDKSPADLEKSTAEPLKTPVLEKDTPKDNCQLEFTLYKYDRAGVEAVKTCLDDKNDEEILKIIKEAKTQTCKTPFCGCWLG